MRSFSPVDCRSASHPWLADHKVHGVVLVPGAAMVELALLAGDRAGCPRVDQLVLHAPLIVGEHGGVAVQVVVGAWRQTGDRRVRIYSRVDDGADRAWTQHAEGVLARPKISPPRRSSTNGRRRAQNRSTFLTHTRNWQRADTNMVRHSGACARCGVTVPRCS